MRSEEHVGACLMLLEALQKSMRFQLFVKDARVNSADYWANHSSVALLASQSTNDFPGKLPGRLAGWLARQLARSLAGWLVRRAPTTARSRRTVAERAQHQRAAQVAARAGVGGRPQARDRLTPTPDGLALWRARRPAARRPSALAASRRRAEQRGGQVDGRTRRHCGRLGAQQQAPRVAAATAQLSVASEAARLREEREAHAKDVSAALQVRRQPACVVLFRRAARQRI